MNRFGFRAIQSTCKNTANAHAGAVSWTSDSCGFIWFVCCVGVFCVYGISKYVAVSMSRMIGKDREVGSKGGTNQNCCRLVCLRVSVFSLHYSILLEIGNIFILQGFFGGDNPDCQKVEDVSSNPI